MSRHLIYIFAIVVLLMPVLVRADTATAQAVVTLTIVNAPPSISSLTLDPADPYSDSTVSCIPKIADEFPEKATVHYTWYRNGELITDTTGNTLEGFSDGDTITCKAVVEDSAHLMSSPALQTIHVQNTPIITKAGVAVLNTAGIPTKTEQFQALRAQGLTSITGYVVNEGSTKPSFVGFLLFMVCLLIVVNINIAIRLHRRQAAPRSN